MKHCPACQAEMADTAKFCLVCGHVLTAREAERAPGDDRESVVNNEEEPVAASPDEPDPAFAPEQAEPDPAPETQPGPEKIAAGLRSSFRRFADRVRKKRESEPAADPTESEPPFFEKEPAPEPEQAEPDPVPEAGPEPGSASPDPAEEAAAAGETVSDTEPAPEPDTAEDSRDLTTEVAPGDGLDASAELKTGQYFFLEALFAIPVIGVVFLFLFSLGKPKNDGLRRFSASLLIWRLIFYILLLAAFTVFMLHFREWAPAVMKFLESFAPAAGH